MTMQKAVILAGGVGSRMRSGLAGGSALSAEATRMADLGLKGLIPVRGRRFLDYAVGGLLRAGLRRICLVVPPDSDLLVSYARRTSQLTGAEVTWAVQPQPLGTADAVASASDFAGTDPFVMVNCDTLYPEEAVARLSRVSDPCSYVVAFDRDALLRESNFGAERIRRFAALVVGDDGALRNIVEKPAEPELYMQGGKLWVSLNLFRFTPEIFDACRQVKPHPDRGELELTDAVLLLATRGKLPVRVIFSGGGVVDLTARMDVAVAERLLEGRSPGF